MATILDTKVSLDIHTTASSSSFATSESAHGCRPESSLSSTAPTTESYAKRGRQAGRRSLALLGKLPKDLSSLIRSQSTLSNRQPVAQGVDSEGQLALAGYGDNQHLVVDVQPTPGMFRPSLEEEEERPTRTPKATNRLYEFLTRSRSRSRSKTDKYPPPSNLPAPILPEKGLATGRTSTRPPRSSSPGARPATRVQSRPISSTTTATNATITPNTSRAKKQPPSSIPVRPLPTKGKVVDSPPTAPSIPSKVNGTRQKKIHALFTFSLPSSRKSSLKSRPTSPSPARGGEGLPSLKIEGDQSATRGGHDAASESNQPANTPTISPVLQSSLPEETTSPAQTLQQSPSSSSRLDQFFRAPKLFSSKPAATKISHRATKSASATIVSAPLKRTPSTQQGTQGPKAQGSITPAPGPSSQKKRTPEVVRAVSPLPPPAIVHTPASPLRPVTSPMIRSRENSLTETNRAHRVVVGEDGRLGVATRSPSGKGKEREEKEAASTSSRIPRAGIFSHSRTTKHGSFDFERPGWISNVIARSGSNGTAQAGGSIRTGENLSLMRDSVTVGPGMAGIGTLQREISLKRVSEEEEKAKQRAEERRKQRKHQSIQSQSQSLAQQSSDPVHASTSTTRTGKSSTCGPTSGNRLQSPTRFMGLSHGLFSFEPPVPSPTFSTGSIGSKGSGVARKGSLKETENRKEELQRERDKKLQRGDRPAVPVPAPSPISTPKSSLNPGYRSGLKGRSLDLGLGLSWAPTRVREDALLPSSTLFLRSASGPSSSGGLLSSTHKRSGSNTNSKRGHALPAGIEEADESERSQVGREVADLFRSVLDTDGYAAFKQYIHRFDAHDIPFEGPKGIVTQVEKLLAKTPNLSVEERQHLLNKFIKVILQNA